MILHNSDCLEFMRTLPDNSVDSIVTDPPYGLSFMGKKWDYDVPSVEIWRECLRVLKEGGHVLSFGGSRTYHRMVVAIEDAGFEIRDQIMWVYGSGFPKSLDVSKAIDKSAGAEREVIGVRKDFLARASLKDRPNTANNGGYVNPHNAGQITSPATEVAKKWQGFGTALKPAHEPICLARKPFKRTVAENVMLHGTGALNIDGCRVATVDVLSFGSRELGDGIKYGKCKPTTEGEQHDLVRWPANFIHDGSEEVVELFPQTTSGGGDKRGGCKFFLGSDKRTEPTGHKVDIGSAARFFYCAKASKKDRDEGLNGFEKKLQANAHFRPNHLEAAMSGDSGKPHGRYTPRANNHPTVKPTDLMRYLCRLVTPPNGVVLDPFMGSGSTGKAARLENFNFIGCEIDKEYFDIAQKRIESIL
jgi:DNA modification methylase